MSRWIRNFDNKIFDDEEDAYLDSIENENLDYLLDTIICFDLISHTDLVYWAAQQDGFWEEFDTQISEARGMNFDDDYREIDEDDEDALKRLGVIPTD